MKYARLLTISLTLSTTCISAMDVTNIVPKHLRSLNQAIQSLSTLAPEEKELALKILQTESYEHNPSLEKIIDNIHRNHETSCLNFLQLYVQLEELLTQLKQWVVDDNIHTQAFETAMTNLCKALIQHTNGLQPISQANNT